MNIQTILSLSSTAHEQQIASPSLPRPPTSTAKKFQLSVYSKYNNYSTDPSFWIAVPLVINKCNPHGITAKRHA